MSSFWSWLIGWFLFYLFLRVKLLKILLFGYWLAKLLERIFLPDGFIGIPFVLRYVLLIWFFLVVVVSWLLCLLIRRVFLAFLVLVFLVILWRSSFLVLPVIKIPLGLSEISLFVIISIVLASFFSVGLCLRLWVKLPFRKILRLLIIVFGLCFIGFFILKFGLPLVSVLLSINWLFLFFDFGIFCLKINLLYYLLILASFDLFRFGLLVSFFSSFLSFLNGLIPYWIFKWFLGLQLLAFFVSIFGDLNLGLKLLNIIKRKIFSFFWSWSFG